MKNHHLGFIVLLLSSSAAYAHPGGLNAEGCHTNRKTGEYHCHKSVEPTKAAPAESQIETSKPATIGTIKQQCSKT